MLNASWVAIFVTIGANLIFIGWQGAQWMTKADLEQLSLEIKTERREKLGALQAEFADWRNGEKTRVDQYIAVWNDGKANRYTSIDAYKDWQLQRQVDQLQDERVQARYDSLLDKCGRLDKDQNEIRNYLKHRLGWEGGDTK